MCILQLLVGCIECSAGPSAAPLLLPQPFPSTGPATSAAGTLLSDEAVCEVVHSCFRISSQVALTAAPEIPNSSHDRVPPTQRTPSR